MTADHFNIPKARPRYHAKIILLLLLLSLASCSVHYNNVRSENALYPVNAGIQPDSNIVKAYLPYKQVLDREMNAVVGYTEIALTKRSDEPESTLGNFFADATLYQALKKDPSIDFAMTSTKGGLRSDIAAGNITLNDVFEMMPFDNELYVVEMTGTSVQNLLDFVAATGGQPVAGIKMKITGKTAGDIFIQGKKFDVNRTYQVLTSDYLANGGDNVRGFQSYVRIKKLGLGVRDEILAYIKNMTAAGKKINVKLDGRITKD